MITIIFGPPGVGKTKLMTKLAVDHMTVFAYEELQQCKRKIAAYNNGGFCLSIPDKHLVFADYHITARGMGLPPRDSYYVNGFRLGLPNKKHDTLFLPFNANVYLSEAQKYFNSRMSTYFSDFISRFYETHRHYGLNITLDCQRPNLIDLNLRGIAQEFIEVVSTSDKYDRRGSLVKSTWQCRVFADCYLAERYIEGTNVAFEERKYEHHGDIFSCYDSFYFGSYHLKDRYGQDFDLIKNPAFGCDTESVREFNKLYEYEVPPSFYTKRSLKSEEA